MATLQPGKKAPAFTLQDQTGKKVKLSDFKGQKLLIYFYPRADTPGCTKQACTIRDSRSEFDDLELTVVGISPDTSEKQAKFDQKYELGFPLLSDTEHKVAEAYGVWGEKNMYGKKIMGIIRSAFLIDEKGKLMETFYKISPKDTVPKVMKALQA